MKYILLIILLIPSISYASDDSVKKGMSKKVFIFSLTGQLLDIGTTELALNQGAHELNPLMRHRAIRIPLKLSLPIIEKLVTKEIPRKKANTYGIIIGLSGAVPAGWNVSVMVRK